MRVAHVSTTEKSGGAARAAHRLHVGLKRTSVASSMYVREKQSEDETVQCFNPPGDFFSWARRRWRHERVYRSITPYNRPNGYDKFSDDRTRYGRRVVEQLPDADIYNLHFIANFVDIQAFFEQTTAPVVWTLHDMVAFTGGCHYTAGCSRFLDQCGCCPQLGSNNVADLSRAIYERKNEAYQSAIDSGRLQVVTPSRWLAKEARRSSLFSRAPIDVIPYGVDTNNFQPRKTDGLRETLGIPSSHRILLFVAGNTTKRRKGLTLLQGALQQASLDDVTVVSIGGGNPPLEGMTHVHLGRIDSDLLLSVFYSMADIFVIPSRQDNLPNTVLESLSCGTPIVGFNNGGIPDMVRPGETGWLAMEESSDALCDTISRALADNHHIQRLGEQCRAVATREYALEVQARKYTGLYNTLLQ